MKLISMLVAAILAGTPLQLLAQTAGAGTLSTIESLANTIQGNDEKIGVLNRQHLESYDAENQKLLALKKKLNDLIAEKANALKELRSGLYCSQCKRPKSEIERGGSETYQGHLRRVNGVSVPATKEHIDSKMAEYDRLIAAQEELIKKFQTEENEFTRKRSDIDKQMNELRGKTDDMRAKIVALSKDYKDKVVQEAKSITLTWVDEILRTLAEKHYAEDRINIINVKLSELQQEEAKAVSELKEKVAKKVEQDKKQLNEKITTNRSRINELDQLHKDRSNRLRSELNGLRTKLSSIKSELQLNTKLTAEQKTAMDTDSKELENRISQQLSEIQANDEKYSIDRRQLLEEIKEAEDKIWELTVNLSSIQEEALKGLRNAFTTKRKILQDAHTARIASLERLGSLVNNKTDVYRKKQSEYDAKANNERIRLLRACEKAGCSCYGRDAQGEFNLIANNRLTCVGSMDNLHANNSVYYGCKEESVNYKGHYHSWVNGLSDSDMDALRKSSSKTRYDMILNKITN
jgi:DNA repair exonuclease SbcCD ATPase subunit